MLQRHPSERPQPLRQRRHQQMPHRRMAAHQPHLLGAEPPRLVQHLRRHADLAHIVQQRRPRQPGPLPRRQTHLHRDQLRVRPHPLRVAPRAPIMRRQERHDGQQVRRHPPRRVAPARRARLDPPPQLLRLIRPQRHRHPRRRPIREHQRQPQQRRQRQQPPHQPSHHQMRQRRPHHQGHASHQPHQQPLATEDPAEAVTRRQRGERWRQEDGDPDGARRPAPLHPPGRSHSDLRCRPRALAPERSLVSHSEWVEHHGTALVSSGVGDRRPDGPADVVATTLRP
jgi:hypothetical protein